MDRLPTPDSNQPSFVKAGNGRCPHCPSYSFTSKTEKLRHFAMVHRQTRAVAEAVDCGGEAAAVRLWSCKKHKITDGSTCGLEFNTRNLLQVHKNSSGHSRGRKTAAAMRQRAAQLAADVVGGGGGQVGLGEGEVGEGADSEEDEIAEESDEEDEEGEGASEEEGEGEESKEVDEGVDKDGERHFVKCMLRKRYRRVGVPWDESVDFTCAAEEVQEQGRPCICDDSCDCDEDCEQCCDCVDCESRTWVVKRQRRNLVCLCGKCKAVRSAGRKKRKRK